MKTWIIGGTSGIGKAIFERLVHDGALDDDIYATDHTINVTNKNELELYVKHVGPFDALVYSAGDNYLEWSQDLNTETMLEIYDVNCVGLVRALQACGDSLSKVVVIGSDAAWRPMRTSVAYNASKAALHAAVQCIARERASTEFAINVVAPGLIAKTPMTDYVLDRTRELRPDLDTYRYMTSEIPVGGAGYPREIAEVVHALLKLETPYLNGAVIPVNGAR